MWVPEVDPAALAVPAVRVTMDGFGRALRRCATAEQVIDALVELVEALGAEVVPARVIDVDLMPIDLSLGMQIPMLVQVPRGSTANMHLEELLPVAVQLAQVTVARLGHVGPVDVGDGPA